MRRPGVHRFLITGYDEDLAAFLFTVRTIANPIEQRSQTVFLTCMDEETEILLRHAPAYGVTVQQMRDVKNKEEWALIVQGAMPGWKVEAPLKTADLPEDQSSKSASQNPQPKVR